MENLEQYRNPVSFRDGERHTNPDPFVLRWCGRWYCYATDELGVKVSVSDDMVHWDRRGYAIREEGYQHYWAPSVLYQNGTFYMYYSNIPVTTGDCHEEHLKLAVSDSPFGPFQWKKTFFEEFSIDSHPLAWNGRLYLFYSVNNWIGTDDKVAGTCILLDELVTPYELAGRPRPVILPSLKQEIYAANRFGDGRDWYTIEGAAHVVHGEQLWLMYSANAYLNEDYFVGTTVAACKERLTDMVWEKYPNPHTWHPLLKKTRDVEGTGHNTVTKAPNLVDDWIVYHGRRMDEERIPDVEQREMYIDPLWFNGNELLCFGPAAEEQDCPGRPRLQVQDVTVRERTLFPVDSMCYLTELWLSAPRQHSGLRYGVYLSWQNDRDYLELQLRSGRKEAQIIRCADGIRCCIERAPLPQEYDYTVPHLLRVSRCFDEYRVRLDEGRELVFTDSAPNPGAVGLTPYFTTLNLHSLTITETACLWGDSLRHFGKFYAVPSGQVEQAGRFSLTGCTELRPRHPSGDFTEEFQLEPAGEENAFTLQRGGLTRVSALNRTDRYSVYHIVQNGQERFLADGVWSQWYEIGEGEPDWVLGLEHVRLVLYRCTKK